MKAIKSVVFDLDGTLWQPETVVLPAYRSVFAELGFPAPAEHVLRETLGHPFDVIWKKVLPDASDAVVDKAHRLMIKAENHFLASTPVAPFAGVMETLLDLRRHGIHTYILSNCQREYLEAVPDRMGIGHLFTDRFCAEDFPGLTKAEIIRVLNPPLLGPAVMVGDRFHDMEAGRGNNMMTIACGFGFGSPGELAGADYVAESFMQVRSVLLRLLDSAAP